MTTRNIGGVETGIRTGVGSLFMVWAAVVADSHPFLALGAAVVATVILVTAIAGVCPLYALFGVNTRPRPRAQPPIPVKPAHQFR